MTRHASSSDVQPGSAPGRKGQPLVNSPQERQVSLQVNSPTRWDLYKSVSNGTIRQSGSPKLSGRTVNPSSPSYMDITPSTTTSMAMRNQAIMSSLTEDWELEYPVSVVVWVNYNFSGADRQAPRLLRLPSNSSANAAVRSGQQQRLGNNRTSDDHLDSQSPRMNRKGSSSATTQPVDDRVVNIRCLEMPKGPPPKSADSFELLSPCGLSWGVQLRCAPFEKQTGVVISSTSGSPRVPGIDGWLGFICKKVGSSALMKGPPRVSIIGQVDGDLSSLGISNRQWAYGVALKNSRVHVCAINLSAAVYSSISLLQTNLKGLKQEAKIGGHWPVCRIAVEFRDERFLTWLCHGCHTFSSPLELRQSKRGGDASSSSSSKANAGISASGSGKLLSPVTAGRSPKTKRSSSHEESSKSENSFVRGSSAGSRKSGGSSSDLLPGYIREDFSFSISPLKAAFTATTGLKKSYVSMRRFVLGYVKKLSESGSAQPLNARRIIIPANGRGSVGSELSNVKSSGSTHVILHPILTLTFDVETLKSRYVDLVNCEDMKNVFVPNFNEDDLVDESAVAVLIQNHQRANEEASTLTKRKIAKALLADKVYL